MKTLLQAQIFFEKDELHGMQTMHEFIMQFLHKRNLKGATLLEAKSGFKENERVFKPNELFSFDDVPMLIIFIDEEHTVKNTLTELMKEVKGLFITTHPVQHWSVE